MCVIIYIPKGQSIDRSELVDAWLYNSDGAGYCMQKNNRVYTKRGFMDMNEYIDEVQQYIGKYNIALHFRISTSKAVNELQTHPYVRNNVKKLQDITTDSVICMNGTVRCDYTHRRGWNDTMNYIADHRSTFKHINKHIIDMIEDETSARWFVMKPNEVLISKGFKKRDGKWYSNTNHIYSSRIYRKKYPVKSYQKKNYFGYDSLDDDDWLFDCGYSKVKKGKKHNSPKTFFDYYFMQHLKKDEKLWEDIISFIETECNNDKDLCENCCACFEDLHTKKEIMDKINIDYYGGQVIYEI